MSAIATSGSGYQPSTTGRIRTLESGIAHVKFWPVAVGTLRLSPGILDAAAVAGPLVFLATTVFLEFAQANFSPVHDTISSLVWGRFGWAQTSVFFVLGLTVIAMAIRVVSIMRRGYSARLGQAMLLLMGVAFIVLAIFPTSSPLHQLGIDHAIHQQTVRMMSALFPLACVLISKGVLPRYPTFRGYTMATAVVAVSLIPAGAVAVLTDATWLGAIERIILGNGLLWAEAMAIQVLLVTRQPSSTLWANDRRTRPEFTPPGRNAEVMVRSETPDHLKDSRRRGNF